MLHPTTFSFRQFCGIAFSLGILLGQLSGVVFQYFLFEEILQNCILKIFPSRQLSEVVLYKNLFEAILRNCILKIITVRQLSGVVSPHFVLKQLYGVVFPQYFFQDNSMELYSQIFPLRQFCRILFSKYFL